MPKRQDIKKILLLGAGPIVIGQACEFDYAGVQACKALKEEGYKLVLVNSNPATIMTDPSLADKTYIEPITPEIVSKIISHERPDALLPTMGGQTALNCALALARTGVLERFGVELIGAKETAIEKAEDRALFAQAMKKIGLATTRAQTVYSIEEAFAYQPKFGYPLVIRPSFTLGGSGGGIAYHEEEFREICLRGFDLSLNHELLLEESIVGWKEFELEVVRDSFNNAIIVCSVENIDPVGVHTGDSITVAPAQTLTDRDYQRMREAALAIVKEIGVDTGGANVQFALHPQTGEMRVIEMNPRVSRSSALASKATGFPIARVAAKLAVGYSLAEIKNELTQGILPMSFEPALDYVVVKIPRFQFDKFPQAEDSLGTQMKSVGEVMAIGDNFPQALEKAISSLEIGAVGFVSSKPVALSEAEHYTSLQRPHSRRLFAIAEALIGGIDPQKIATLTGIDPWFIDQMASLVISHFDIRPDYLSWNKVEWLNLKRLGWTDANLAKHLGQKEASIRTTRLKQGVKPAFKRIDSCAGEFKSATAYLYSSYYGVCEAPKTTQPKIVIIGSGPNRIGQGIEFDYCCVHAAIAVKEAGYEAVMVNCNPETVSTDYDVTDRLYFEPLTAEAVLGILALEQPEGVILQLGGQTPLKLADVMSKAGYPILGTSVETIHLAEDRATFAHFIEKLGLRQPKGLIVSNLEQGIEVATQLTYPVLVRPSFVLGGQRMQIIHSLKAIEHYFVEAFGQDEPQILLVDQFLAEAIEVDVDLVSDGQEVLIVGMMAHIEEAGIHSGDSTATFPPRGLSPTLEQALADHSRLIAKHLGIVGLMNIQFACQGEEIFVLEVNPRASRSLPFVAKATGYPLIQWAVQLMLGRSLADIVTQEGLAVESNGVGLRPKRHTVKMPVFPFIKFKGVDPLLGPEMKSTGEVMGQGLSFGEAYLKALLATNQPLPRQGRVYLALAEEDRKHLFPLAQGFLALGFELATTGENSQFLEAEHLAFDCLSKPNEARPTVLDKLKNKELAYVVITAHQPEAILASKVLRRASLEANVLTASTVSATYALLEALAFNVETIGIYALD